MTTVDRRRLTVGSLLAEGGEGRVYEIVGRPDALFKAYRRPVPLDSVAPLLSWRQRLRRVDPLMESRLTASTAWPSEAVISGAGADAGASGSEAGVAVGLVIPRAPRRFSVRHRDGARHLATLSYLTADPRHRGVAYGLALPPAAAAERIALVYALARLLEAFDGSDSTLAHGDLSAKNVLWSLERGPEVYVIDCDGSRLFGRDGPLDPTRRPHVATPNWEDPAATGGADPGPRSDRYSLALIFLRVMGAAHYPIQARQKLGEPLRIEVEIPVGLRRGRPLGAQAAVWGLCARGLGVVDPDLRPSASRWARCLEATLHDLGAGDLAARVRANQGDGRPAGTGLAEEPADTDDADAGDVTVRPVPAEVRSEHWRPVAPVAAAAGAGSTRVAVPAFGWAASARLTTASGGSTVAPPSAPVLPQARAGLSRAWRWWLLTHRRTGRALRSRGRRMRGLRRLVFCAVTDFALACVGLFLIAMIVSPFLGI